MKKEKLYIIILATAIMVRPRTRETTEVPKAGALAATTDLHILRKVWHVVGGLGLAMGYAYWLNRTEGVAVVGLLFGLFALFEIFRQRSTAFNKVGVQIMGPLLRSHEVNGLSGSFYFFMGAIFAILVFPKPIAIISLVFLSCGDPVASAVGWVHNDLLSQLLSPALPFRVVCRRILCGRGPWSLSNGKSLCGAFAGGLVCGLVTWFGLELVFVAPTHTERLVITAIGTVVPSLTELFTPAHRPRPFPTDDNFLIPLVSGLALLIASWWQVLPSVPHSSLK